MKKFAKYEEKYPLLLEAYKVEKRKSELIDTFEKLLSENTPISSISDAGVLIDYLKGLSEKTTMLNNEMRRLSRDKTNLAKSKSDLEETVSELQKSIRTHELNALQTSLTQNEPSTGSVEIDETKQKLHAAEKELVAVKDELAKLTKSFGETQKLSEGFEAENKQLRLLNTEKDDKLGGLQKELEDAQLNIATNKKLEDNIKKLQTENDELTKQLSGASTPVEKEESPISPATAVAGSKKKKNKKKNNKQNVAATTATNSSDNQSLKERVTQLEAELQSKDLKTNEITIKEYRELKDKYQLQSEDLAELKDLLREVGNELVDAKERIKEYGNKSLVDVDPKFVAMEADLENLKKEKAALEVKISELELLARNAEQLNGSEERLEEMRKENERLIQSSKKLQATVDETTLELEKATRKADSLRQEKDEINKRISELSKYKSSDTSLKLELSSLQVSLDHKEKLIKELTNESASLRKKVTELEDNLALAKRQKLELDAKNKSLVSDKNELITKQELQFEKGKSLEQQLFKIQAEKQSLVTQLETTNRNYENMTRDKQQALSELLDFKQRYEELYMRSKDAQDKVESMQDEISEARNMLLERTRESNTIRRLLMEAEESIKSKDEEVVLEIRSLKEEKENLEAEWMAAGKKKQREIDEMKSITNNYLTKLQELESRYNQLKAKYDDLAASKGDMKETSEDAEETSETIDILRASLRDSAKKIKDYENVHSILKKLNEESNLKFERLLKSYKLLTQQYRSLKDTKSQGHEGAHSEPESTRTSLDTPAKQPSDGSNNSTNVAYLKNVLLGFFEHKDQRDRLLPVVKMLFDLSPEDEQKFLMALK